MLEETISPINCAIGQMFALNKYALSVKGSGFKAPIDCTGCTTIDREALLNRDDTIVVPIKVYCWTDDCSHFSEGANLNQNIAPE